MLSFTSLIPLIPLLSTLVQSVEAFDYRSAIQGKTNRGDVPGRYVLEFDTSNDAKQVAKRDGGLHDHIYAQLKARGVEYDVTQTYDSDLFVGASVGLANAEDYETLAGLSGISAIYPVSYVPAPLPFSSTWGESQKTGYHPEWNLENIHKAQKRTESKRAKEEKNPKPKAASPATTAAPAATSPAAVALNNTAAPQGSNPNGYSFLPVSGVDKVHAEGNTGKGIKIAVIDSGVFYTNPALGGCLGAGCVIAGGRDYVGDEFDGTNAVMPDDDPLDCTGHGTFVTGIISAQLPNAYNVSGVAPGASIYAYRVFSCYSATTNDIVAKAMEDAYTDGNDVINLSLGEISSWSGSMLSVIGSRIAAKGVSVLASSGNAGFAGTFYTDSPASGVEVLSVGVADAVNFPGQNATLSYRNQPLSYIGLNNLGPGTFPLVSLSNGTTNGGEVCGGIPDLSAYDVNNVVFVVQASTTAGCDYYTQGYNLLDGGAVRVLIITGAGVQGFLPPRFGFELGVINAADGQEILQRIAAGETITATFAFAPNAVLDTVNGGLVSFGSAIGPTNDMYMSTQLTAPGNNIVSTAPTASGFGASGGSSYSCAYVAGVAALYLSANGGRAASGLSARGITRALQIVSDPFPVSKNDSRLNTVAIGGAGLVQAYEAIHTPIKVSKSEFLLNDTANFADYQTFDVVNTGKDRQKFSLSHLPALTAYSFKQGSYESELAPVPLVDNAARVKFVPPVLNLKAGESKTVVVKFELPQGLDSRRLPIYSGFVQVSTESYNVQLPYLGVAASMKSFPVLDNSTTFTGDALPNLVNANMTVQTGPASYNFEEGNQPTLMYRYWVGSRLLTVDLIQSNQALPFTPTISSPTYTVAPSTPSSSTPAPPKGNNGNGKGKGKGLLRWLSSQLGKNNQGGQAAGNGVGYEDVSIVGNVYERVWIPRNSDGQDGEGIESFAFNGTFSDRSVVPAGDYRLLVRSLRVAGDMALEADYDSWVSPVVNVVRA